MKKSEAIAELQYLLEYVTPIEKIKINGKTLFIKREDFIPFSFGGNKVRIAAAYFIDAIEKGSDIVVTYGASSSNLCRVIANMAFRYGMKCVIVSPEENYQDTPNSRMVCALRAEIIKTPIDKVSTTIDEILSKLKSAHNPYFIYGGGHGIIGSRAYKYVMKQICCFEEENEVNFDKIYIPLATGTSMGGLIIENEESNYNKNIVGISVARNKNRAIEVLKETLNEFKPNGEEIMYRQNYQIFDDYTCGGYGKYNKDITDTIQKMFFNYGINFDTTYTGKAFFGMMQQIADDDTIVFIHTGGTPLFYNENCNALFEWEN